VGWLAGSGLALNNGIVVDRFCRSPSDPHCYAVGDVANADNAIYGRPLRLETWRNAERQAAAVAGFISGSRSEPFAELPWMWSDQYDLNLQVVGFPGEAEEEIWRGSPQDREFCVLGLRAGAVVAGTLVNQGRNRRPIEAMVESAAVIERSALGDASIPLKQLVRS
jgi:3-phenylpropionate/trans-cinnamate dioxygenase ferredoxin reductase subunit